MLMAETKGTYGGPASKERVQIMIDICMPF